MGYLGRCVCVCEGSARPAQEDVQIKRSIRARQNNKNPVKLNRKRNMIFKCLSIDKELGCEFAVINLRLTNAINIIFICLFFPCRSAGCFRCRLASRSAELCWLS